MVSVENDIAGPDGTSTAPRAYNCGMRLFTSPHHRLHNTAGIQVEGHACVTEEVPARAEAIAAALREARLGPLAEPPDLGLASILAVHPADYVQHLQTAHADSAAYYGTAEPVLASTFFPRGGLRRPGSVLGLTGYYAYGAGSPILPGTWTAAYWAAQCAAAAAEAVLAGESGAYALCRPPGHHAAADLYGGFCYLNNAAIAARRLQAGSARAGARVAILDVDYHHGNGTQMIFYADPGVLFVSLHVHPDLDYPYYWGAADETGTGAGTGFNLNIPLPLGTGDSAYLRALETALDEVAHYEPQYLVLSAGFDTLAGDPVGGFELTLGGLRRVAEAVASRGLPTVIVQEGGYVVERLGQAAVEFLTPFAAR